MSLLQRPSKLAERVELSARLIQETGQTPERSDVAISALEKIITEEQALLTDSTDPKEQAVIAARREGLVEAVALNAKARLHHERSQQQLQPAHDSLQAMLTQLADELDQGKATP